jgi:hypothetical protein
MLSEHGRYRQGCATSNHSGDAGQRLIYGLVSAEAAQRAEQGPLCELLGNEGLLTELHLVDALGGRDGVALSGGLVPLVDACSARRANGSVLAEHVIDAQ